MLQEEGLISFNLSFSRTLETRFFFFPGANDPHASCQSTRQMTGEQFATVLEVKIFSDGVPREVERLFSVSTSFVMIF